MSFLLLITLASLAATPIAELEVQEPRRPNVVLILADDLGIGDLGCYNPDSRIPTPHMDRIASEGIRLTDAHSPSSVCTPTRYGLLTGRYAWRTSLESGVLWGSSPNLIDPETTTLPELLRDRGYTTGGFGKWHLGLGDGEKTDWSAPLSPGPLDHGFDTFFGIPASLDMAPYVYVLDDRVVQAADSSVRGSAHRRQGGGGFWRAGDAAADFRHIEVLPRLAQRATEFIERSHRESEGPFFLYFPLTAPHTPWLPTEGFADASSAGHYGDFVAQVDDVVGQVLDKLDSLELAEDTLVIVTSDNGSHWPVGDIERWGHAANLDYRGQKADIWEGGHRVPFLARWPGELPADGVRDQVYCLTDVMATVMGALGEDLAPGVGPDSFDGWSVFRGDSEEPIRDHIVHHSLDGMFSIRSQGWKLVLGLGSGGFTAPKRVSDPGPGEPVGQLFDLTTDRSERENLHATEAARVEALTRKLEHVQQAGFSRPEFRERPR